MIRKLAVALAVILLALPALAQKMTADEVLNKHLEAVGTADSRAAVQNIIVAGEATVKLISQRDVVLQGRIVMASAGPKNFFGMSLNSNTYPGEQFIYDGKKTKVAFTKNNQRSELGNFVQANDALIKDSLFSGILASTWVPSRTDKNAKFSFDGTKKIDGKEVYAIGYSRKGSGDLTITMFFDKATFRHVRTEYKRVASAPIGRTPGESSGISELRFSLVEDFSDFKDEGGLTMPHNYRLVYSASGGQTTGTIEIQWDFKLTEFALNQKLDEKTFSTDGN